MAKRLILNLFVMSAIVLTNLPGLQAQTFAERERGEDRRPRPVRISSYKDDPFVRLSTIERLHRFEFGQIEERLNLFGPRVWIQDESVIYRENRETGEFKPFAWNPWPETRSNENGGFSFPFEERFPLFRPQRDAEGKIVLRDGLQVWLPNNLNLGMTTAFEAASAVKVAAETWAGRDIFWGNQSSESLGVLQINSHSFIDFNGFYAPEARQVFLGVVPYRLPGETAVKMFETATSWEMVAHECGHAVHHTLKPNVDISDKGFRTWTESFSDQVAMWASLQNQRRAFDLLTETNGNFNQSNSLSRLAEAFAALTGEGTGLRDAFHNKKVSDTSSEEHDRSEVITGSAYRFFLAVYSTLIGEQGMEPLKALRKASEVMGMFLTRANDFMPENRITLEDVAKAYLKVDKEFFGSRYHVVLVNDFMRRELFDINSLAEWFAHEAATPNLHISRRPSFEEVESLILANLDKLGIGSEFGLRLQSVVHDDRYGQAVGYGQTIVRVQLTQGRGDKAIPLGNHGILVFRTDGSLADYHAPLPPSKDAQLLPDAFSQAATLLARAKRLSLDERGAPLSITRKPNGQLTIETRVVRGEGLNTYLEVFSLENPRGERREILIPPVPPNKRIAISADLIN